MNSRENGMKKYRGFLSSQHPVMVMNGYFLGLIVQCQHTDFIEFFPGPWRLSRFCVLRIKHYPQP